MIENKIGKNKDRQKIKMEKNRYKFRNIGRK